MPSLILTRIFLATAAIFGGLSVAGGAFATHALKNQLTDRALGIFETGARYQMYHALALLQKNERKAESLETLVQWH